jgi:hypothetical protein
MNKVPVSWRALLARVNRALAKQDQQLHRSRTPRAEMDLGEYYVRDTSMNIIVDKFVDPEDLAREFGVLKDYEEVILNEE